MNLVRIAQRIISSYPSVEYLVLSTVEFPGSGGKTYRIRPGVALESEVAPDGSILWNIVGWHAPQKIDLSGQMNKMLDLRKFFSEVAKHVGGTFIPPRFGKVFTITTPESSVGFTFADSDGKPYLEAAVQFESSDEDDYFVQLSVEDFANPEALISKVL